MLKGTPTLSEKGTKMEDKIMSFVGICMGLLCLTFAGMILTVTIKGTEPTKTILMEINKNAQQ